MGEGLRERKKAETRAALKYAALELADRLGPDKVSIEAIALAAGVSPRTFFNYFASKEDAILGGAPSDPSPLADYLRARPDGEAPLDALRAASATASSGWRTTRIAGCCGASWCSATPSWPAATPPAWPRSSRTW